ncbi:MAG: type 1 glutamine amidotransferase [Verrucomicrobia bacterium]|nr:type 1 glutamine amidotransferase [Verrucomicrobiota bacterium]
MTTREKFRLRARTANANATRPLRRGKPCEAPADDFDAPPSQPPCVCAIQHIACETPGIIGDALKAENVSIETVRTFDGQSVPRDMKKYAALVVMGGPMGVYEQKRHAHLRQELRLIEQALRDEKPILGICLGSQLLAAALGAPVTPGRQKEIGWFTVALSRDADRDPLWNRAPSSFTAYIWHGDVFELPKDAVSLASSELTAHQAFRFGRNAYGILFHMEITEKIITKMVASFADELRAANVDGNAITKKMKERLPPLQRIGTPIFRRWALMVKHAC